MRRFCVAVLVGQLLVGWAAAQYPGMPVGSVVDPGKEGTWQAGLIGGVSGDGARVIGARGTYALNSSVKLFADLGRISGLDQAASANISGEEQVYDSSFAATALQLGAIWDLPIAMPAGLDLGVRLALMKPFIKGETWSASDAGADYRVSSDVDLDVDIIGGSLSALVSRDLAQWVPGLSAYGFAGLHVVRTKVEWSWTTSGSVNLGFGFGGASGSYTESGSESSTETDPGIGVGAIYNVGMFSIFAELAHVSETAFAAGALVTF